MSEISLNEHFFLSLTKNSFCIRNTENNQNLFCSDLVHGINGVLNFLAKHNFQSGQVVVFCGRQSESAFVWFWATILLGGIFTPLDPASPAPQMCKLAERINPAVFVSSQESIAELSSLLPQQCFFDKAHIPDSLFTPSIPIVADSLPAVFIPTSGSTGKQKIVVLSRAALLRSALTTVAKFGWNPTDILLNTPEPYTMSGLRNALIAAPISGATWLCHSEKQEKTVFHYMEIFSEYRPTRLVIAPLLLRQINLIAERFEKSILSSVKALYCTGANLHKAEVIRFYERFQIPVINYYGLTETSGICISQEESNWDIDDNSLGKPVGCQIRIVDDNGNAVPDGKTGELQIDTPNVMTKYFEDPTNTSTMFANNWLRTGDLAMRDSTGKIYLAGRCADFINTVYTEKISPLEIESALEELEGIAEAAVFGLPDANGGERIAALIVPVNNTDPRSLDPMSISGQLTKTLRREQLPTIFRIVSKIPRSSNGKILRKQIPDLF